MSRVSIVRGVLDRRYLTVRWLVDMMAAKAGRVTAVADILSSDGPVTCIGLDRPENLPPGSLVITLDNLHTVIPR